MNSVLHKSTIDARLSLLLCRTQLVHLELPRSTLGARQSAIAVDLVCDKKPLCLSLLPGRLTRGYRDRRQLLDNG